MRIQHLVVNNVCTSLLHRCCIKLTAMICVSIGKAGSSAKLTDIESVLGIILVPECDVCQFLKFQCNFCHQATKCSGGILFLLENINAFLSQSFVQSCLRDRLWQNGACLDLQLSEIILHVFDFQEYKLRGSKWFAWHCCNLEHEHTDLLLLAGVVDAPIYQVYKENNVLHRICSLYDCEMYGFLLGFFLRLLLNELNK